MEKFKGNIEMKEKTRDINVEVIRIIAMLMIIMTHCLMHQNLIGQPEVSTGNYITLHFIRGMISIQNALFILISGYYAIRSKFNLSKILKLWGKTFFYSFIFYIIYTIWGRDSYPYENLLPILSGQYWFITAYIALYLISPILSMIIKKLTKNQFKYLLILLMIFYSIIRITLNPSGIFNGGFGPVLYVYLIGAYISLHVEIKKEKQLYLLKSVILVVLTAWLSIFFNAIYESGIDNTTLKRIIYTIIEGLHQYSSILIILSAVFFFMKFKSIDMNQSRFKKIISFISPSIFSIYLIHENINNRWIWAAMNFSRYGDSPFLVTYVIGITIIVFIVCLMIDSMRRLVWHILKKIPCVSKFVEKLNEKINKINVKVNQYLA